MFKGCIPSSPRSPKALLQKLPYSPRAPSEEPSHLQHAVSRDRFELWRAGHGIHPSASCQTCETFGWRCHQEGTQITKERPTRYPLQAGGRSPLLSPLLPPLLPPRSSLPLPFPLLLWLLSKSKTTGFLGRIGTSPDPSPPSCISRNQSLPEDGDEPLFSSFDIRNVVRKVLAMPCLLTLNPLPAVLSPPHTRCQDKF